MCGNDDESVEKVIHCVLLAYAPACLPINTKWRLLNALGKTSRSERLSGYGFVGKKIRKIKTEF